MVTIVEKISIIIDTDLLFALNNPDVQAMIDGDTYRIDGLYKESIKFIKEKSWYRFKHLITEEIKTLDEWIDHYQCDKNDPKSVGIFLRIAEPMLI